MSYALGILPRAQRELGALPTETYQRLREAIFALAHMSIWGLPWEFVGDRAACFGYTDS